MPSIYIVGQQKSLQRAPTQYIKILGVYVDQLDAMQFLETQKHACLLEVPLNLGVLPFEVKSLRGNYPEHLRGYRPDGRVTRTEARKFLPLAVCRWCVNRVRFNTELTGSERCSTCLVSFNTTYYVTLLLRHKIRRDKSIAGALEARD